MHRFLCPQLAADGLMRLDVEESTHAVRVLRLKAGDECELFDGRGSRLTAIVDAADRRAVLCRPAGEVVWDPKHLPGPAIEIAVGLPKEPRQRSIVEKVTELGIHQLRPLDCRRSVATGDHQDRLRRYALESCKQSGRNGLPQVASPVAAEEYFANSTAPQRFFTHVEADGERSCERFSAALHFNSETSSREVQSAAESDEIPPAVCIAVGPEGGWDELEVQTAIVCGWHPLSLGSRILRVETAVAFVASLCVASRELR